MTHMHIYNLIQSIRNFRFLLIMTSYTIEKTKRNFHGNVVKWTLKITMLR